MADGGNLWVSGGSGGGGDNLWSGRGGSTAKKGGGGLLHDVVKYSGAELAGNLAEDIGSAALGVFPGLYHVGKAVGTDLYRGARHPLTVQHNPETLGLVKQIGKSYEDYYGSDTLHHLYEHPLQPALDALTVLSLGGSAAVKAGVLSGERAQIVTRSPRAIATGKGPVSVELTGAAPITRARRVGAEKTRARLFGEEGVKGHGPSEVKRYGKGIQQEATQNAIVRLAKYQPYVKATHRLSDAEWTALHLRAQNVHPADLAAFWKGTPNEQFLTPKVVQLTLEPSKRMLVAEPQARLLSEQGRALLPISDETAAYRPALVQRQASEMLGREARTIPGAGDAYYFPHTLEPTPFKSPLRAQGGGKAPARLPGTAKQNLGVLSLAGKIHLRSDIIGPEFLRRVKYVKYQEIHRALVRGAVRVTRADLDANFNGRLPKGYEYVRESASTRVPFTMRGESDVSRPLNDLIPNPADLHDSRLADGFTTSDPKEAHVSGGGDPQHPPYVGKGDEGVGSIPDLARQRGFLYHRAAADTFDAIRANGLRAVRPAGENPRGVYFANEPIQARGLSWKRGGDVFLRVRRDNVRDLDEKRAFGETLTPHDVPASAIEYLGADGRWRPLAPQAHYYIVPKATAKAATGEFTRSGTFAYYFNKYPLQVWRAIVLGLRVGFLTNNLVGNSIMYAVRTVGQGALRDLFAAIIESHGRETGLRILRNPSTPAALRKSFYREFYPEQKVGTFGRTQSPATGLVAGPASHVTGAARTVAGALPRLTSKVAEEVPREALTRNFIRNSPEFKKVWKAMPRQTRTFEAAARQLHEGKVGKQYQRAISKQVSQALGDYLHMNGFERTYMRNLLPFYSWYRAIVQTTYHLAVDTPLRANILGQIGQIGFQDSRSKLGEVPSFLRAAIPLGEGKGGTTKVLSTQAVNPYATLSQIGRGSASDIGDLGLNPFIYAPIQAIQNAKEGKVAPAQVAKESLYALVRGLPLTRLAFPVPPSRLYPNRNRQSEFLGYLGVPIKDVNPAEAARQKKIGR